MISKNRSKIVGGFCFLPVCGTIADWDLKRKGVIFNENKCIAQWQ
jgi:hypothetical protein